MSWDEYFLGRNPNVLSGIYGKPNDFDHAAEVEKLEGELVEQARLLGMGGEREAKLMAEVAALRERVRVLECLRDAVQVWMDGTPDGQADHCNAIFEAMAAIAQPQPKQKEKGGKP